MEHQNDTPKHQTPARSIQYMVHPVPVLCKEKGARSFVGKRKEIGRNCNLFLIRFRLDGTVAKTSQVPSGRNCNVFGYGSVAGTVAYALNQTPV